MKPSRPIGVTTSKPLGWTDHLRTADMEVRVGQLGVIQGDLGPLRCRAVGATVAICFAVEEDRVAGLHLQRLIVNGSPIQSRGRTGFQPPRAQGQAV